MVAALGDGPAATTAVPLADHFTASCFKPIAQYGTEVLTRPWSAYLAGQEQTDVPPDGPVPHGSIILPCPKCFRQEGLFDGPPNGIIEGP